MSDFGTPPTCGGRSQNKDLWMPKMPEVVFMEIWLYDNLQSLSFFQSNFQKDCCLYKQPEFQAEPRKKFTVKKVFSDSPSFSRLLLFKSRFSMCLSFATFDKCSSQTHFILASFTWVDCRGSPSSAMLSLGSVFWFLLCWLAGQGCPAYAHRPRGKETFLSSILTQIAVPTLGSVAECFPNSNSHAAGWNSCIEKCLYLHCAALKEEIRDMDCGEAVGGTEELKCSRLLWQEDAE